MERTQGARASSLRLGASSMLALVAACATSLGPTTIPRDRIDYSDSIARAGQQQMLANLVKMRYGDSPEFLEVSSIINQYAIQGQLNAGGQFPGFTDRDSWSFGGAASYSDRPTITYAPLTGDKFIKSLLTPIRPETIFSLVQAGWPIDAIFQTTVRAINGVYNRSRTPILKRAPDPQFMEMLAALRRLQGANAIGLRLDDRSQQGSSTVIVLRATELSPQLEADSLRVREILGLGDAGGEFRLSFGTVSLGDRDIVVLSRSMLEIMSEIAASIDVPELNVTESRVNATDRDQTELETSLAPFLRIHCAAERPTDAHVATRYRDTWFWIDDCDYASKRQFSFLSIFFQLAQGGIVPTAPLVTIGAGS